MKKLLCYILSFAALFVYRCAPNRETSKSNKSETTYEDKSEAAKKMTLPQTNADLFDYIIEKWRENDVSALYEYAGSDIVTLMSKNDFIYTFESISQIGGSLKSAEIIETSNKDGADTFSVKLDFDNITADLSIKISDVKIISFIRNIFFKNEFEIKRENNIVSRYFILENDGFDLNAVYTYVSDGKSHPTVLLISGSGPSDYNETIGLLTPFEDIAAELAKRGINSFRLDKRTLNYAKDFKVTDGINEEYLSDCKAAIEYIKSQGNTNGITLLGHSLGGQIVSELAAHDKDIAKIILLNSSACNLAEIACDQYCINDPANEKFYIEYREAAVAATEDTAKGLFYYGATDYYWATLNKLDTIQNIKDANIPTLIINSTNDKQSFNADIQLWQDCFKGFTNVSIVVDDSISHLVYEIDVTDNSAFYRRIDLPDKIINLINNFIK